MYFFTFFVLTIVKVSTYNIYTIKVVENILRQFFSGEILNNVNERSIPLFFVIKESRKKCAITLELKILQRMQ